jgi:hypothetical protein
MATPTTLPASFVSGAVLTASQMNNLRGAFRILQVVSTTKTDSFSTTSTTYVDVTGVSATITPSSTDSKILVVVSGLFGNSNSTTLCLLNLVRGSTNIAQSTGGTSNSSLVNYTNTSFGVDNFSLMFLDSPATTSATTYKLQMRVDGNTGYVGRLIGADIRAVTTLTVFEVSA